MHGYLRILAAMRVQTSFIQIKWTWATASCPAALPSPAGHSKIVEQSPLTVAINSIKGFSDNTGSVEEPVMIPVLIPNLGSHENYRNNFSTTQLADGLIGIGPAHAGKITSRRIVLGANPETWFKVSLPEEDFSVSKLYANVNNSLATFWVSCLSSSHSIFFSFGTTIFT